MQSAESASLDETTMSSLNATTLPMLASGLFGGAFGGPGTRMAGFSGGNILNLLTSFTTVSDWVKLFILGGALETGRRFLWRLWNYLLSMFYIEAQIEATEPCYQWMMVWLADNRSWTESRKVIITSSANAKDISNRRLMRYTVNRQAHETNKRDNRVQFQPMFGSQCNIWYKNSWIQINRLRDTADNMVMSAGIGMSGARVAGNGVNALRFTVYGGSHGKLSSLIEDAHKAYKAKVENKIRIWSSLDVHASGFTTSIVRPKRSLESVVLDDGIKNILLEDAKDFLSSERWYSERGIPWRRGYLLHGCPGSGKTSLIHALAGELDLDIYVISLSKRDMDDAELSRLISALPARSIALMEDIDVAFTRNIQRDQAPAPPARIPNVRALPARGRMFSPYNSSEGPQSSGVTLAGLLAAIDGVAAQEGRILFATTNRYSALDPALRRPGRLDLHIEFHLASSKQAKLLFERFYPAVTFGGKVIGTKDPEKAALPETARDEKDEKAKRSEKQKIELLTDVELSELATEFANQIPEWEFSMAAIQGHLMRFKTNPREAVAATLDWMEQERKQKADWETKQTETDATVSDPVATTLPITEDQQNPEFETN